MRLKLWGALAFSVGTTPGECSSQDFQQFVLDKQIQLEGSDEFLLKRLIFEAQTLFMTSIQNQVLTAGLPAGADSNAKKLPPVWTPSAHRWTEATLSWSDHTRRIWTLLWIDRPCIFYDWLQVHQVHTSTSVHQTWHWIAGEHVQGQRNSYDRTRSIDYQEILLA